MLQTWYDRHNATFTLLLLVGLPSVLRFFVNTIFMLLVKEIKPYSHTMHNNLAYVCAIFLLLCIMTGTMFEYSIIDASHKDLFGWMLLFMVFIPLRFISPIAATPSFVSLLYLFASPHHIAPTQTTHTHTQNFFMFWLVVSHGTPKRDKLDHRAAHLKREVCHGTLCLRGCDVTSHRTHLGPFDSVALTSILTQLLLNINIGPTPQYCSHGVLTLPPNTGGWPFPCQGQQHHR